MNNVDREFYFKLSLCENRLEIEQLIENIDDDDLHFAMEDKYNQILEFNKEESLKNIKKIIEFKYMDYRKNNK